MSPESTLMIAGAIPGLAVGLLAGYLWACLNLGRHNA